MCSIYDPPQYQFSRKIRKVQTLNYLVLLSYNPSNQYQLPMRIKLLMSNTELSRSCELNFTQQILSLRGNELSSQN